eukprot:13284689-Heterocapsa_arctica.AAC.1
MNASRTCLVGLAGRESPNSKSKIGLESPGVGRAGRELASLACCLASASWPGVGLAGRECGPAAQENCPL